MNQAHRRPPSTTARELAERGFCIVRDAVDHELATALAAEARVLRDAEGYRAARIGTGDSQRLATTIRSDRIHWLDDSAPTDAQREYLAVLEELRLEINAATYLGLFEWEGHFAHYPPGAFYRRHLDVFAHARQRQVSTVLYLNEDWIPGDGGVLRLWTEPAGAQWKLDSPTIDVEPTLGTLVVFLSEDYYHEVLPARVARFSLTGWFRTR